HGDGAGDHARASATFLTGCQARKTGGADIKIGVSVDQIAAQRIGSQTRLPSLELGCESMRHTSGDSGYSCAYGANLSWRTGRTRLAPEVNPRLVFERLFSSGIGADSNENRGYRTWYQKSVLDFVMADASHLKKNLGHRDRNKLDEYLTAVRELEKRIEQL